MSVETRTDGANLSALVREEQLSRLPHDALTEHGTGGEVACDLLTNELPLDGSARLNPATLVTTFMSPRAAALMADTADKKHGGSEEPAPGAQ